MGNQPRSADSYLLSQQRLILTAGTTVRVAAAMATLQELSVGGSKALF